MIITHIIRAIRASDFETAIQLVLIADGANPASLEHFAKACGDRFRLHFCADFVNSLDAELQQNAQLMPVQMTPSEFLSDVRNRWPLSWPYYWGDCDGDDHEFVFGSVDRKPARFLN